jgi:hypothetical protein
MSLPQSVRFSAAALLAAACLVLTTPARAALIAHWTFDAASLSTDGGGNIIGAADQTGNHNATLGTGVGSATVANGGPTFNSNTIPGTNSIAGKFGEALTLTGLNTAAAGGGQYLMFPQLYEIMSTAAPAGYTISMWINTTTTNAQQFTLLGSWGNAAAATGKSRFTYGYGFQFASGTPQMRAQGRNGESSGDIYARAVSTAGLNNGSWHMLTWTFDTASGVLLSYFDGVQVDSFTSGQAVKQMLDSSSALGTFGLKGDSGNFLNGTVSFDEVRVYNSVLGPAGIAGLFAANQVPEPATLAFAVAGLVGLVSLRRRMPARLY